jgi:hypothetical protein
MDAAVIWTAGPGAGNRPKGAGSILAPLFLHIIPGTKGNSIFGNTDLPLEKAHLPGELAGDQLFYVFFKKKLSLKTSILSFLKLASISKNKNKNKNKNCF